MGQVEGGFGDEHGGGGHWPRTGGPVAFSKQEEQGSCGVRGM